MMISPEGLEVANMYLQTGSAETVAYELDIPVDKVTTLLDKAEVRRYIDNVYLDRGYRNRFKLGALLDEIIESKLLEARESEVYSSKDLLEILQFAHKMRMDEAKLQQTAPNNIKQQTNVQINDASGNYGELMKRLLGGPTDGSSD